MSLAAIRRARGLPLRQLQLLRQAATGLAACMKAAPGSGSSSGSSAAAQLLGTPKHSQLWRYDSPLLRHLSTAADTKVHGVLVQQAPGLTTHSATSCVICCVVCVPASLCCRQPQVAQHCQTTSS
jgi:hypothetical protein